MTQKTAPSDSDIASAAYLIWLAEGRPEGRAEAHWHAARAALAVAPADDTKPAQALGSTAQTGIMGALLARLRGARRAAAHHG